MLNLTDKLSVLAAVRLDRFRNGGGTLYAPIKDYNQTTASPKLRVVFQPVETWKTGWHCLPTTRTASPT